MKTIIILLLVLAILAVAAWKLWKSINRRPSTVSATTSMAGKKDVATVSTKNRHEADSDFVLGRLVDDGKVTRQFVTADGTGGIVVGPTGAGKTQGIVIPTIVRHKGPLLATSTKSELADLTMSARSRLGSVAVIDPAGVVDGPAAAYVRLWTPLQACKTFNEAALTTSLLVEAGGTDSGKTGSSVWTTAASSLLTSVLWVLRQYPGTSLSDVQTLLTALMAEGSDDMDEEVSVPSDFRQLVKWISNHPLGGWDAGISVCEHLAESGRASILDAQRAAGGLRAVQQISGASETVAGVVFGVQGALMALVNSEATWFSAWDDAGLIDLQAWASEPAGTIYVVAPDMADPYRGLFCAFATAAMGALDTEAWSHPTKSLTRPALFMLDELANVVPLPQLPRWLATKRSQNVKFVLGLQGLGQLWGLWSDADAEAIINNCDAFLLVLSGTQDDKTTDRVEKYAGEYLDRIETVSRSKSSGTSRSMGMSKGGDSRSETDSTNYNVNASYRPLVKPSGLFQMAYGRAAVLMPRKKFAVVEMVPAHADKDLQAMMLPAPPPPAPPVYRPTALRSRKLGETEDGTADFFTTS